MSLNITQNTTSSKRYRTTQTLNDADLRRISNMINISDQYIITKSGYELKYYEQNIPKQKNSTKKNCHNKGAFKTPTGNVDQIMDYYLKENPNELGYIKLPECIINIQYLYGRNPILPQLLHLDLDVLEGIIDNDIAIVIDPGKSSLHYKQILCLPEYWNQQNQLKKEDVLISSGTEAIKYIANKEQIPYKDNIILHTIPVLPWKYLIHPNDGMSSANDIYFRYRNLIGLCIIYRKSRVDSVRCEFAKKIQWETALIINAESCENRNNKSPLFLDRNSIGDGNFSPSLSSLFDHPSIDIQDSSKIIWK